MKCHTTASNKFLNFLSSSVKIIQVFKQLMPETQVGKNCQACGSCWQLLKVVTAWLMRQAEVDMGSSNGFLPPSWSLCALIPVSCSCWLAHHLPAAWVLPAALCPSISHLLRWAGSAFTLGKESNVQAEVCSRTKYSRSSSWVLKDNYSKHSKTHYGTRWMLMASVWHR